MILGNSREQTHVDREGHNTELRFYSQCGGKALRNYYLFNFCVENELKKNQDEEENSKEIIATELATGWGCSDQGSN